MGVRVPWTFELARGAEDAVGIEDFAVESADGERIGTVAAVLRRDADLFLAVEQGYPPMAARLRAVAWREVADVDTTGSAVRLALPAAGFEDSAFVLDPDKKVEGGPAEAVRVVDPPPGVPAYSDPAAPGPRDRPAPLFAHIVGVLGAVFTIIGAALVGVGMLWGLALCIPGFAAFAGAGVALLRAYRNPYARRRRPPG